MSLAVARSEDILDLAKHTLLNQLLHATACMWQYSGITLLLSEVNKPFLTFWKENYTHVDETCTSLDDLQASRSCYMPKNKWREKTWQASDLGWAASLFSLTTDQARPGQYWSSSHWASTTTLRLRLIAWAAWAWACQLPVANLDSKLNAPASYCAGRLHSGAWALRLEAWGPIWVLPYNLGYYHSRDDITEF